MWLTFSFAVEIVHTFAVVHGRWACNILWYLIISAPFAWYSYITVIANFSLLLTLYLTRVRRRPLSKQNSRCVDSVECICVLSAVAIGLMVANVVEIYNHALDLECAIMTPNLFLTKFWAISLSIFFGMDLEIILISISLCVIFCFIHQRISNRQTAVLLRNSVILVAVNASIMGLDSFRVGYKIYAGSKNPRGPLNPTIAVIYLVWDVVFMLAVSVSIITQAVLCVLTSTQKNACCKTYRLHPYHEVIDGKDTAATNPASSRVSQPSYTNFAVPYTGEFTQVTTSIDGDKQSE